MLGSSAPPSAQGATTSTSAVSAALGSVHFAPLSVFTRSRLRSSMSATISRAPARASRFASFEPTRPTPTTATVRPFNSGEPKRLAQQARIAASTPWAVNGLGSPLPPLERASPATCFVRVAITAMSRAPVPTSSAVVYRPSSVFTVSAKSSSISFRRLPFGAGPGSAQITPFPPPSGTPAAAALKVIARASLSASRAPSAELS